MLLVFPSFNDDLFHAVAFLYCGVNLSESKLMVWDPVLRVQIFIDYFEFDYYDLSRHCGRGGSWRQKFERLNAGESNGKLLLRTCPGCSVVQEPYRSPDWALVSAQTSPRAE
jgi:hypothetical protein